MEWKLIDNPDAELAPPGLAPTQDGCLNTAQMPADFREVCARIPDPRCDEGAALLCKKMNQGVGPAQACLFHGEGDDGPLSER